MKIKIGNLFNEFSVENLSLKHDKISDFYTSQWQKNNDVNIFYMLYRIAIAIIFIVTTIFSILDINQPNDPELDRLKWLIYLTHWSYAICLFQATLSCFIIIYKYCKKRKNYDEEISSKLCSFYWMLFTIAVDSAFVVTSVYWSFIFKSERDTVDAINLFVHGLNSVFMMTDLLVVAHPVRLLHCYIPVVFGAAYIIFNIIYYYAGGTDKNGSHHIYEILDWDYPDKAALFTTLAVLFLLFIHCFTYFVYLLRKYVSTHCKVDKDNNYELNQRETKVSTITA